MKPTYSGQSSPEDGGGIADGRWHSSRFVVIGSLTVGKEWCIVYQNVEAASEALLITGRFSLIIGCERCKNPGNGSGCRGPWGQSIAQPGRAKLK